MPLTRESIIQHLYSTSSSAQPDASLEIGEIAINAADEAIFIKNSAGTVKKLSETTDLTANLVTTSTSQTITGDKTFSGTVTLNGSLVFEGATANNFETTLTVTDPDSDQTITLPNATGTVALIAGSDTQVQFNDGGSLGGDSGLTYNKTTDTLTVAGDLAVNGADITTTSTGTAALFNTNATTLNIGGAGTTVSIGAATGTATINNANTVVAGDLAVNGGDITTTSTGTATVFNTTATTVNAFGAATSLAIGNSATSTQVISIGNGATVSGSFKTITIGGNGSVGSSTGVYLGGSQSNDIITLYSPDINLGNDSSINFANATMAVPASLVIDTSGDTFNIGGTSSNLVVKIGDYDGVNNNTWIAVDEGSGIVNVNSISGLSINSYLSVDGGDISTAVTGTATLFNANATTVNIAGAATTVSIGAATGTTTVNNKVSSSLGYTVSSSAINTQTGTSYTLLSGDNGKIVTLNNGSPITLTVPSGLATGFNCTLVQLGSGQVTITASGTTLNSYGGALKIAGQYGAATLISYASNTYSVAGTLTT